MKKKKKKKVNGQVAYSQGLLLSDLGQSAKKIICSTFLNKLMGLLTHIKSKAGNIREMTQIEESIFSHYPV